MQPALLNCNTVGHLCQFAAGNRLPKAYKQGIQQDSMVATGGHSVWQCGMLQNGLAMHMCTWGLQCNQYVLFGLHRTHAVAKRKGCIPRKCQTGHHKHTKLGSTWLFNITTGHGLLIENPVN